MKYLSTLGFVIAGFALFAQGPMVNLSSSGKIDCAHPGATQATLFAYHNGVYGYWEHDYEYISDNELITVTKAGEYTFCAYDAQGHMTCKDIYVGQQNTLPVKAVFCGNCSGDFRIGLQALPTNYTGYWTNGPATSYDIQCAAINAPGTWIAHAIDPATGCESNDAIQITSLENKFPNVNAGTDIGLGCGYSVHLNGSGASEPGMISHLWTTIDGHFVGDPKTTDPLIDKIGTYVLSIWNLGVGCVQRDTCLVKPGYYKWLDTLTTNILCQGASTGAIDLTPNGPNTPYTYLWTDGDTTEDRHNLKAGTYKVLITEKTGCAAYRSVTLTEPDSLDFKVAMELTSSVPIVGYKVTLTATGGYYPPKYQYRRQRMNGTWTNWTNSPVFLNVPKQTLGFSVRVNPSTGCNLERTKFVAVQTPFTGDPVEWNNLSAPNQYGNLLIYPNPARNAVEVIFPDTGEENMGDESFTISLYDALGRLTKNMASASDAPTMLTWGDELAPGVYFVTVRDARGTMVGTGRLEISGQ
ncbi:MAG: T9SS type A sorting domain-containing protein [Saprospiraceae bacterium]